MRPGGGFFLVTAALLAAACAGLVPRAEPPHLTLVDVRLRAATLLAQDYLLTLQLQNPNDFDLAVDGMACELLLNDHRFASGVSSRAVSVPRYGTANLQIEATGTLFGLFRQLSDLEASQAQSLRYQLRGHVSLRGAGRLPFDHRGEVALVPQDLRGPI